MNTGLMTKFFVLDIKEEKFKDFINSFGKNRILNIGSASYRFGRQLRYRHYVVKVSHEELIMLKLKFTKEDLIQESS